MGRRLAAVALAVAAMIATGGSAAHAAAARPDDHRDVISVVRNPDGTTTETSYTPAPGVEPAALARKLRAAGVPNVAVADETEVTTLASSCSYGTARTWASSATCFVRWSYGGYTRPQLYFRDQSSSLWPVGRAVTQWNETSGIDSIYRTWSTGCPGGGTHCIPVYSGNYGSTGWTGLTSRTLNSAGTYYASAYSKLNDYYGGTESQRWGTACHELGHVLGLDHNTSTGSCLYYQRVDGRSKYPNSDDYHLLERYY